MFCIDAYNLARTHFSLTVSSKASASASNATRLFDSLAAAAVVLKEAVFDQARASYEKAQSSWTLLVFFIITFFWNPKSFTGRTFADVFHLVLGSANILQRLGELGGGPGLYFFGCMRGLPTVTKKRCRSCGGGL